MKPSLLRINIVSFLGAVVMFNGCAAPSRKTTLEERPDVAPTTTQDGGSRLQLDASQIKPMFTELLPIDLPTVVRVAVADISISGRRN